MIWPNIHVDDWAVLMCEMLLPVKVCSATLFVMFEIPSLLNLDFFVIDCCPDKAIVDANPPQLLAITNIKYLCPYGA